MNTHVSGEVPGLLGAGFAEAASLPDSIKQEIVLKHIFFIHQGKAHFLIAENKSFLSPAWLSPVYLNCVLPLGAVHLGRYETRDLRSIVPF